MKLFIQIVMLSILAISCGQGKVEQKTTTQNPLVGEWVSEDSRSSVSIFYISNNDKTLFVHFDGDFYYDVKDDRLVKYYSLVPPYDPKKTVMVDPEMLPGGSAISGSSIGFTYQPDADILIREYGDKMNGMKFHRRKSNEKSLYTQ